VLNETAPSGCRRYRSHFVLLDSHVETHELFNSEDALLPATIEVDDSELDTFSLASTPEWRSVCSRRHNMLLEGPQVSTEAVLLLLKPYRRGPVAWKRPEAPFDIQTNTGGALVVQDIAALSRAEQR